PLTTRTLRRSKPLSSDPNRARRRGKRRAENYKLEANATANRHMSAILHVKTFGHLSARACIATTTSADETSREVWNAGPTVKRAIMSRGDLAGRRRVAPSRNREGSARTRRRYAVSVAR